MAAKLYWFPISHPSQAVRRMLDLKGIDYEFVEVIPGNQRIHLRVVGFRGGTVPGLKLDGRRVQGSVAIARALEELVPEPSLYPADPDKRRAADEAERWGDEEFQSIPRRIFRHALVHDVPLRRWLASQSPVPFAAATARLTGPVSRYYARLAKANEEQARRDVAAVPSLLDRVDRMLADGTLSVEHPTAATFQVLCTVRALDGFEDFHALVDAHACGAAARTLFPEDFTPTRVPAFVPSDWSRA